MSDSPQPPWIIAHQALPSMEFSRQEYWNGLSFPTPGDLPYPGIELVCLMSTALAGRFFTTVPPRLYHQLIQIRKSRLIIKYYTTCLIAFC